jgi:hypothetical protein
MTDDVTRHGMAHDDRAAADAAAADDLDAGVRELRVTEPEEDLADEPWLDDGAGTDDDSPPVVGRPSRTGGTPSTCCCGSSVPSATDRLRCGS